MTDMDTLSEVDGYAAWREKEANDLSDLVQRRLDYLQNPVDCGSARKLVCNLNKVISVDDLSRTVQIKINNVGPLQALNPILHQFSCIHTTKTCLLKIYFILPPIPIVFMFTRIMVKNFVCFLFSQPI
jgi:hypothetical protein